MATLTKRTRGGSLMFEIKFYVNGKRKTIPLGVKYTERTATELLGIVETLVRYNDNGIAVLDRRTQSWIETATPELREKLAKAGLIELPPSHTVKELWDSFLNHKARELKAGKIKEATMILYGFARNRFFMFFKENELIENLTKDKMQHWKDHLLDNMAEATAARYIKDTKACFNWGVSESWIEKSPLDGVGKGSFINRENDHIVSMSEYRRFLDACPAQEWRVIIALVRIGALRCPSEVLQLRWEDVNWEYDRFFVHSPKTDRHKGKEGRWVPIFPELKEELEALFFNPNSDGQKFVINRYRDTSQNLRTTFGKIVLRAGLDMFPRPFDNMRMTRSNEIYRKWGAFKESEWVGHSRRVREDHYLSMTDADFQEAAQWSATPDRAKRPDPNGWKNSTPPGFPPIFPPAQDETGLHGLECDQREEQH